MNEVDQSNCSGKKYNIGILTELRFRKNFLFSKEKEVRTADYKSFK